MMPHLGQAQNKCNQKQAHKRYGTVNQLLTHVYMHGGCDRFWHHSEGLRVRPAGNDTCMAVASELAQNISVAAAGLDLVGLQAVICPRMHGTSVADG